MGTRVDVRTVSVREGDKNGKHWRMVIASCIVTNADGSEAVGQILLPKDHPEITRGLHDGEVNAIETQDGVVFRVTKLTPVKVASISKAS